MVVVVAALIPPLAHGKHSGCRRDDPPYSSMLRVILLREVSSSYYPQETILGLKAACDAARRLERQSKEALLAAEVKGVDLERRVQERVELVIE